MNVHKRAMHGALDQSQQALAEAQHSLNLRASEAVSRVERIQDNEGWADHLAASNQSRQHLSTAVHTMRQVLVDADARMDLDAVALDSMDSMLAGTDRLTDTAQSDEQGWQNFLAEINKVVKDQLSACQAP